MCLPVQEGRNTRGYRVQVNTECVATGPHRYMDKSLNSHWTPVRWDTLQHTNIQLYRLLCCVDKTYGLNVKQWVCFCYQAGSCWSYRLCAVQVVQRSPSHQVLALWEPFYSALTNHHHTRRCTQSRVTTRWANNPLEEGSNTVFTLKLKPEVWYILAVARFKTLTKSIFYLDITAGHSSPSVRCQRRKDRPLFPGRAVSLFSGHAHRKLSRNSTGSRAHKLGRESWCTPKCHCDTHCRWRGGEVRYKVADLEEQIDHNVWSSALNVCQSCSHQVLQSMVSSSLGLNSSVPLPDGIPHRHSVTATQRPSCNSWPSGQRQPMKKAKSSK